MTKDDRKTIEGAAGMLLGLSLSERLDGLGTSRGSTKRECAELGAKLREMLERDPK